jgi:hypothetical protein
MPRRFDAPRPGIVPLRPLSLGELLEGSVQLVRHAFAAVAVWTALVVSTVLIAQMLAALPLRDRLQELVAATPGPTASSDRILTWIGEMLGSLTWVALLTTVVTVAAFHVLSGLLAPVVAEAVLGRRATPGAVPAAVGDRLGALGLVILAILTVTLGPLLVVVALGVVLLTGTAAPLAGVLVLVLGVPAPLLLGAWAYTRFAFAVPAVVLERQSAAQALARSRLLVQGAGWRVFGILLLGLVLYTVVSSAVAAPFSLLANPDPLSTNPESFAPIGFDPVVSAIVGAIGSLVTLPFLAALLVLVYVDQRMRREGLAPELAQAAGVAASN